MSRRAAYLRHVASYFGRSGVGMLVSFALMAFLRHRLGDEGVGLWTIAFSLGSYLGLADLNTHASVTKYVAELEAQGRGDELAPLLGSALRLIGGLSFGLLALSLAALPWVADAVFKTTAYAPGDLRLLAALCLISFACLQTGNVFQQVLAGLKRQDEVNLIGGVGVVLNAALVVVVVLLGLPLWAMGMANLLGVGLVLGITRWRVAVLKPGLPLLGGPLDKAWLKRLWHFSLAGYAFTLWGWLYFMVPKMLLANQLGPVWVAYYEYATKLGHLGRNVVQMLSQYLLPFISELKAAGEALRSKALMMSSLSSIWMIGLGWGAYQAALRGPILAVWLGSAEPATLTAIGWVAVEFSLGGLAMPLVHFAFAEADFGHTRPFLAYIVPACVLGPLLGLHLGGFEGFLIGAALANSLGTLILYAAVFRHRGLSLGSFGLVLGRITAASALAFAAGHFASGPAQAWAAGHFAAGRPQGWAVLAAGSAAFALVLAGSWAAFGLIKAADLKAWRRSRAAA